MDVKPGDIFFTDSDKTGPKIVKFFMQSSTVWHWVLGKILKRFFPDFVSKHLISPVRMYHAGIFRDQTNIIEQQWKIQDVPHANKILKNKHVIWRLKRLSDMQRRLIVQEAEKHVGQTYDVLLIVGKTLTWLTGIPWFVRHIQNKDKEICVTFVAYLYYWGCGYTWGRKEYSEVTTDVIDDFNVAHPDEWEIVSIKE